MENGEFVLENEEWRICNYFIVNKMYFKNLKLERKISPSLEGIGGRKIRFINLMIIFIICLFFMNCSPKNSQEITVSETAQPAMLQTQQIQVSTPNIQVDSLLFKKSTRVNLDFSLPETDIYYTLNGENPQKYNVPFDIRESTEIDVQARKNGFQDSDWVAATVFKVNNKTQNTTIELTPEAHENYPATGAGSLIDLQKGKLNFRAGQFWSGFQAEEVVVRLNFETMTEVEKIYLSLLSDHNSWIFLPKQIEVWNEDELVGTTNLDEPESAEKSVLKSIAVDITPDEYKKLVIKILNHKSIPDWHAGKGTPPWLFMDEIFVE